MLIYRINWTGGIAGIYFTNPAYGDYKLVDMERRGYGVGNLITREVTEDVAAFLMRKPVVKGRPFDMEKQVNDDYRNLVLGRY